MSTFAVAVVLRYGFDLSEEESWPILIDYNKRCEPPWSEKELRHKLTSAGKLCRHSRPRGYLRGGSIVQPAKPAKPAKQMRLRAVSWQERVAEVAGTLETQGTGEQPASVEESGPPEGEEDIIQSALRMFNGKLLTDAGLEDDMRKRLSTIENVLSQRGSDGRVAFTASQIESCLIGLRGFAGQHPDVDIALLRLSEAKTSALTWRIIAGRA